MLNLTELQYFSSRIPHS